MKKISLICLMSITILFNSCKTTKIINKAISSKVLKDSTKSIANNSALDSLKMINETMVKLKTHYIDFKTFNAKIRVDYEDNSGKQPDLVAVLRMVKDSAIWMSVSYPLLNIELYRMFITKDSLILMDIRKKTVQYRSLDYLQDVTEIPFDFKTLQDLFVGNPVFLDNSKTLSYKKDASTMLINNVGLYFKNLLTLNIDNDILLHSKLDDIDVKRNRTADISYDNFQLVDGINFPTYIEILVSEKNKVDVRFRYKQFEFNKELSVSFKVPQNYKTK